MFYYAESGSQYNTLENILVKLPTNFLEIRVINILSMISHEAGATTVYAKSLCKLWPVGQIWLTLPVLDSLKLRMVFTFFKNDFYIFKRSFKKKK